MKTKENKLWIINRRAAHHAALATLATSPDANGFGLWRKLRKLEQEAHDAATAQCNGGAFGSQPFRPDYGPDGDDSPWQQYKDSVTDRVKEIFGTIPKGFFFNGDARGYALKLDPDKVKIPQGMETDWGGNGLLAAEIE